VENPFSWDYLTAPIRETSMWGPFSIAYLILFGALFIICAFLFADANRRFAHHKLNRDTVRRFATWLMWVSAMALFFFGIRALQTPILTLEKRIWMYLTFLAFLLVVAKIVHYMRTEYPAKLAAFDRSRERRAWQHAARRPGGQAAARKAQAQAQPTARKRRAVR
jgi:small-conductance mechanosensitive channel